MSYTAYVFLSYAIAAVGLGWLTLSSFREMARLQKKQKKDK